ncbi:MAG: hypothetical protein LIP12_15290 [Clostridiales bacterium]|nr:hypothetical protein [Clostridiales bacterium]MCC8103841.1 hypothetical protein [Clostridiales bacterium]
MVATRLNIKTNAEIQKNGLSALQEKLGVTGTIRFLEQYDHGGEGDYTAEKYMNEEPEPSDAEIRRMFGF